MDEVKFPNVTVELVGHDGNAISILMRVERAMRRAGVHADDIALYRRQALAGDYDNVLAVTMATVQVE